MEEAELMGWRGLTGRRQAICNGHQNRLPARPWGPQRDQSIQSIRGTKIRRKLQDNISRRSPRAALAVRRPRSGNPNAQHP
jgi:hypothetical protein